MTENPAYSPPVPQRPKKSREVWIYVGTVLFASLMSAESIWLLLTSLVLAVTAVALRHRHPAVALVIGGFTVWFAAIVLAYNAGRRITRLSTLCAAVAGDVAVSVALPLLFGEWTSLPTSLMIVATGELIQVIVPMLIGRNAARRALLVDALRDRAVHLERERRSVAEQARVRERSRIAVDMHDNLGHQLTLISLQAGGMKLTSPPGTAQAESAALVSGTAQRAMEELRDIIGVLGGQPEHARVLEHLPELLGSARASGAVIDHVETGTAVPVARVTENAIYRVVQEGLTNAARHAPGAEVSVRLNHEPDGVIVEVVNGPAEGEPETGLGGGQGLTGLRERVRLAGGVLHYASTEDNGFRLAAVLPHNAVAAEETEEEPLPAEPVHPLAAEGTNTIFERLRGRPVVLGLMVTGVLVTALAALVVTVFFVVFRQGPLIGATEFDRVHIGQSEQEVVNGLQVPHPRVQPILATQVGAEPPNSRCVYYYGDLFADSGAEAFRFCFADGKLSDKRRVVVGRPF
ncbi:histidine kinase [Allokutzneria sp. A3M-2-11 16]|uniref:sensor histidine kinase n=1 Tax=Allokutzneria sp. A3M-2-11 16 TaxID=2962043 RepID=UPI0020B78FB6|nr:histidine kinase [Allokutzneria sp. A3M-2-11 16]MCP3803759.1 histidine kinase [Allokutzneria sp. A3M-2-11 16]